MLPTATALHLQKSHSPSCFYLPYFEMLTHSWVPQKPQLFSLQSLPHSFWQNTRGGAALGGRLQPWLSPLDSILMKTLSRNSIKTNIYEKQGGGGMSLIPNTSNLIRRTYNSFSQPPTPFQSSPL